MRSTLKFLGGFLLSLAVCFGLIGLLQIYLPAQLANILLGTQMQSYPLTFQTIMWFPFAVGVVAIVSQFTHVLSEFRANKKVRDAFLDIEISDFEEFDAFRKSLKLDSSLSVNSTLLLIMNAGLDSIEDSSRFADIKEDISSQAELIYARLDTFYSKVRYLSWLLPTLGFMGTVYGISVTVVSFGKLDPSDPNILSLIAKTLAVAFDTTLLSLGQSSILILFITLFEAIQQDFVAQAVTESRVFCRKLLRSLPTQRKTKKAG